MALGLVGSVVPDLDLLYFYLIDQRQHVHHSYWPHKPLVWVLILVLIAPILLYWWRRRDSGIILAVAGVNVLVHLVLGSLAGGIAWLWPFSDTELVLVSLEAKYDPWYLNFIFHWTFLLEIAVVFTAVVVIWFRLVEKAGVNP